MKQFLFAIIFFLLLECCSQADNSVCTFTITFVNQSGVNFNCPETLQFNRINQSSGGSAFGLNGSGGNPPSTPAAGATYNPAPNTISCISGSGAGATGNFQVTWGGSVIYIGPTVTYDPSGPAMSPINLSIFLGAGCTSTSTNNGAMVFTNYTLVVNNIDSTRSMSAQWLFNGAVIKSSIIPPLGSDSATSPSVEVSPTPQVFTFTSTAQTINSTSPIDTSTNGAISFAPPESPPTTSTFPNNGAATNSVTPPVTPPVHAPTNLVTFTAPTGAASESTLNQGIQLLHQDNINALSASQIIDQTLTTGLMVITNQLGQAVTMLTTNAFIDGMWLPQIAGAITNLGSKFTNNTVSLSLSNLQVNLGTNLDQEATQSGISNLLSQSLAFTNTDDGLLTNVSAGTYGIQSSDTNGDAAAAAAISGMGDLVSVMTAQSNSISTGLTQTVPDSDGLPSFTFTLAEGTPFEITIDFSPFDDPRFSWAFVLWHAFVTWALYVWFARGVLDVVRDVIQAEASAQTTGVPNLSGGGVGSANKPTLEA